MHQPTNRLSKIATGEEKSILRERLVCGDKRNLLYLGSGRTIRKGYSQLAFNNIVLVDPCFRDIIKIEGNIICIGLWSTFAIALFKEVGVRFSAYITGNDGLAEGGGRFSLNSNWCLGNLLPIMENEYLHIAIPSQYGQRKWKKMFDLPQTAAILDSSDPDYLDPSIFTDMKKPGFVWRVTKKAEAPTTFRLGNRQVTVQRRNIWDAYGELDKLFIRCSPDEKRNLKSVAPKVEYIKDYTFEGLLQYCYENKIESIGLCPWLRGSYNGFLDYLSDNEEEYPYPKRVNFFHLHQNDLVQVYLRAEQSAAL